MKANPVGAFFVGVKEEAKKISWPTRAQTIQLTIIVIISTVVTAAYLGIIDYALSYVIKQYLIK